MSITINPGSGPVRGATHAEAVLNIKAFAKDLEGEDGVTRVDVGDADAERDGRYVFLVTVDGKKHEVEMPGLPLRQVNYGAEADDDIWDFPRLYVDGSSWVWPFALNVCLPDDEEDAL
jgi:hypothetical protein